MKLVNFMAKSSEIKVTRVMIESEKTDIARLHQAYKNGVLTPVDVLDEVFARIDALNDDYNAFVFQDHETSYAMARASHKRWEKGAPLSPLDGIPVTVKDNIDVKGWPTLKASKAFLPAMPREKDNAYVSRLRDAGAVFVGKTALCELGHKGVTDSLLHGITRNPHNRNKTCGGSSGGAAVAAHFGLGLLHLGNDGGGSIRIPASFCGVWGIKPTYGEVKHHQDNGLIQLTGYGSLARSYDDLKTGFEILSGRSMETSKRPLRVAYAKTFNGFDVQPDVARAVDDAVMGLKEKGHHITPIEFNLDGFLDCIMTLWNVDILDTVKTIGHDKLPLMDPSIQKWVEWGQKEDVMSFADALKKRHQLVQAMELMIRDFDVLVMPTMPLTAFDAGRDAPPPEEAMNLGTWWTPFTAPFNLSGWPAMSAPIGNDSRGLPIGLQITALGGNDEMLFHLAKDI